MVTIWRLKRKKSTSKIKIQGNFPYKNIVCFLLSGWQNRQKSGKKKMVKKWLRKNYTEKKANLDPPKMHLKQD